MYQISSLLGSQYLFYKYMSNHKLIKRSVAKRYVSIKDLSIYTSLPVKSLYELAGTGRLPSIKLGRRVLFDLHDIDKVMAGLKQNSNQYEETVNKIVGNLHGN
jgi:predicted DNA-binding transcriptional regulator AlpA